MIKFKRQNELTREELVAKNLATHMNNEFFTKAEYIVHMNNVYIHLSNNKINLVYTVCNTDYGKRIKIEDVLVKHEYRNKGYGTKIIKAFIAYVRKHNCITGLWCELDNDRLFNYYTRLGFNHITTRNDKWLEY